MPLACARISRALRSSSIPNSVRFTLTSIAYYGITAWLPSVYVDRGWSHASAGALITVVSVVTLPASIVTAWVGDRTPCYLASGKPVVVQYTGPSSFLPDGEGLFRFSDLAGAARALDAVDADYGGQCQAARALAEALFDARAVAERILDATLAPKSRGRVGDA